MSKSLKILFIGESCVINTTEIKGNDVFNCVRYNEPACIMQNIFEKLGHQVTHIPCHRVSLDFPKNVQELCSYDVLLMSDVGSNTMLLPPETARMCRRTPNKLKMIEEFVRCGGGYGMIGGYMTFTGIDAKGKYKDTIIEKILPVTLMPYDDRVEVPEGADLSCDPARHEVLSVLPRQWPFILGYNRLVAKPDADVIVQWEDDPIITLGRYGKGRTMAYATDCTPHWAPPEMHEWEHYPILWDRLVRWLAGEW